MNILRKAGVLFVSLFIFMGCSEKFQNIKDRDSDIQDLFEEIKVIDPENLKLEKHLLYDQHTLLDTYPYRDTFRLFQWNKIRVRLADVEVLQYQPVSWGILQNYREWKGVAPLVKNWVRNEYKRVSDTLGTERWQSVPLYMPGDTLVPERYALDGSLVKCIADTGSFTRIKTVYFKGEWFVPTKYIKKIKDSTIFNNVVFVDRKHQNITTLEKSDDKWLIRSMNPATTGVHRPPYQQETPLGIFVLQEKKPKMLFLKDGSTELGGFAPYANRFCCGAYIHGVPVNVPGTNNIEYSSTLGTTPRSHMCVRNATSHAKFIYDWAPTEGTLIFLIE